MNLPLFAEITSSGDLLVWVGLGLLTLLLIVAKSAARWFHESPV